MARFFVLFCSGWLMLAGAMAQDVPPRPGPLPAPSAKPAEAAPQPTTLESLHERLAKARDADEARAIAKQIERRWMRSGSDTVDLLMTRAQQVMTVRDAETALELFDHIVLIKPEWAEAYHQRALLLFQMNDLDGAMRDILQTLTLEPRHFGALSGLGMVYQKMEQQKSALAAFTKALELHPYLDNLRDYVERMRPEVEGRKT